MRWPEPTTEEPTPETLMAWKDEGGCEATDGCWLDDGRRECRHGCPSWAAVLELAAGEPGA